MNVSIIDAQEHHVRYACLFARKVDREEASAQSGTGLLDAALRVWRLSAWSEYGSVDGDPVAVFGVVPLRPLEQVGLPWMIGTDFLPLYWRAFARYSKPVIQRMRDEYQQLENEVAEDNLLAVQWLSRMGFTVSSERHDLRGVAFRRFTWRRDDVRTGSSGPDAGHDGDAGDGQHRGNRRRRPAHLRLAATGG